MAKSPFAIFLSCEHASNAVPAFLTSHFESAKAQKILRTHRGYDIGAADVFWELAKILHPVCAIQGAYTRLAIDLNRNCNRNHRYSEFTENASPAEKERLEGYWDGYRDAFLGAIRAESSKKDSRKILHLSIHSFTPKLNGVVRNADLGILYDPARKEETSFAKAWEKRLSTDHPGLRVRFNYPYPGKTDGHATALRKRFSGNYLGFEIEMNQTMLSKADPRIVAEILANTVPLR